MRGPNVPKGKGNPHQAHHGLGRAQLRDGLGVLRLGRNGKVGMGQIVPTTIHTKVGGILLRMNVGGILLRTGVGGIPLRPLLRVLGPRYWDKSG